MDVSKAVMKKEAGWGGVDRFSSALPDRARQGCGRCWGRGARWCTRPLPWAGCWVCCGSPGYPRRESHRFYVVRQMGFPQWDSGILWHRKGSEKKRKRFVREWDRQTKDPRKLNKGTRKTKEIGKDHSLMRREDGDGDDNGDNGSHSGPDGQNARSSLAPETPSAGGENASKWPLFTDSKHYNSWVRNLLILPTLPFLDIASDAFCCRLCYIWSCSEIKDASARAGLMDWIMIKGETWLCSSWHTPLMETRQEF